jgi:hypothetical protein
MLKVLPFMAILYSGLPKNLCRKSDEEGFYRGGVRTLRVHDFVLRSDICGDGITDMFQFLPTG